MAVGGVICCGRWAAGLAGCGVGRCWRWAAGCCEVWRRWLLAVGNGQAVQLMGCGVIGAALAVLILPGAGGGRNIRVLRPALPGYFPAFPRGGATPSACRAADPAGRAGGRAGRWAKEKGQGGGALCAAALAFCLHWRCDLLRRVHPGAYRGRRWSAPRSGAGLLALALIQAQRFRLHLIRLHGCRWRCSIRAVFAVCRRGQILHLTGVRSRCRALT